VRLLQSTPDDLVPLGGGDDGPVRRSRSVEITTVEQQVATGTQCRHRGGSVRVSSCHRSHFQIVADSSPSIVCVEQVAGSCSSGSNAV
jgi:hypothetical protein